MHFQNSEPVKTRIGIIGGGVGGATIALQLSQQGADVYLFEKESSLVNGPPMCHLHAGGNLYREISDVQCVDLLKQSVKTARLYQDAIDYRPTIVAVPQQDNGHPDDVIARLNILQQEYAKLIEADPQNQVLGPASQYFKLFQREDIDQLATEPTPKRPKTPEQWMIAFAKTADLDQLKFPLILVQEYGISVFRLAAISSLTLEKSENCQLLTNTQVTAVTHSESNDHNQGSWTINTAHEGTNKEYEVDYLINACGFRTGTIDDMIGLLPKRMVEFKAAYISQWSNDNSYWPEIIFYGTRGTINGMTQLTPYPNGYFQIHAMTPDITLFEDGLVSTQQESAQPQLPTKFLAKVNHNWDPLVISKRTAKAIDKVAGFIPTFESAILGGPPMYGAQQIPGVDSTLRVADVSFHQGNYARCEIVKASSALPAAETIIDKLVEQGMLSTTADENSDSHDTIASVSEHLTETEISERAEQLAAARKFPKDLAGLTNAKNH